jgi:hypothetical protein
MRQVWVGALCSLVLIGIPFAWANHPLIGIAYVGIVGLVGSLLVSRGWH